MELAKSFNSKEQADDLIRLHYIENYASFVLYDIPNAKKNALITIKVIVKAYREIHKKLVLAGYVKGDVEETQTYIYWEEVKAFVNDYKSQELT